eukprot:5540829-Heterocapsa_arctica.AAC.1
MPSMPRLVSAAMTVVLRMFAFANSSSSSSRTRVCTGFLYAGLLSLPCAPTSASFWFSARGRA